MSWVVIQSPDRPFPDRSCADIRARNRARTCQNTRREGPLFPAFSISRLIAAPSSGSTDVAHSYNVQSPSVSATRMPALYMWFAVRIGDRMAARTMSELDEKLPPRMTPISQFPGRENADPSTGISSGLGVQQSSTHSQALPCISKIPHWLGLKLPTGAAP